MQHPTQPQAPQDNQDLGPVYIATATLFALTTQVTYTRWLGMLTVLASLVVATVISDPGKIQVGLAISAFLVSLVAFALLYHNSIFQGFRRKMGEELEAEITGQSLDGSSGFPRSFRAQRDLFDNHERIDVGGQPWPPEGCWGELKLWATRIPHQGDLITAFLVVLGTTLLVAYALFEQASPDETPSGDETQLVLLLEQYRLAESDERDLQLARLLGFCGSQFDREDTVSKVCSSIWKVSGEALDLQVDPLLRQLLK